MSPDESGPSAGSNVNLNNILVKNNDQNIDLIARSSIDIKNEYSNDFEPIVSTNPFQSSTCSFRTQQARDLLSSGHGIMNTVGIVIPVRNEKKNELLKTIESILKNSGDELKKIIIVDDFSTSPIDKWPEWNKYMEIANNRFDSNNNKNLNNVIEILRLKHRNGVSKSKSHGIGILQSLKVNIDVYAFLDAHVIVSKDWLLPLIIGLQKNPDSLVYPAIDIIDRHSGDLIKR